MTIIRFRRIFRIAVVTSGQVLRCFSHLDDEMIQAGKNCCWISAPVN